MRFCGGFWREGEKVSPLRERHIRQGGSGGIIESSCRMGEAEHGRKRNAPFGNKGQGISRRMNPCFTADVFVTQL